MSKKLNSLDKRPVSTLSIASRVIENIDVGDHLSQRSIAQSCRISQSTVSKIIKSANFVLRKKKRKVHKLTLSTIEKRRQRALRQLANYRYNRRIVVLV